MSSGRSGPALGAGAAGPVNGDSEILLILCQTGEMSEAPGPSPELSSLLQHWAGWSRSPAVVDWYVMLCDLVDGGSPIALPEGAQVWRGRPIGAKCGPSPVGAVELLINMMSIDAANEDEFNAWYDTEHIPRLSQVPGVVAARRFKAVLGRPAYAAIYHVAEPGVIGGEAWRAAASTPWTSRIQALRSDSLRLVLRPA